MRDSPFPSPLKLCFRYEYEYESHLPLIRSPRATIPSISIKMGRCLGSIMRARHFSRFPSSSSRPRAEEGVERGEGGGKKKSRFCLKKKKGGERSETRKTLSPWGKFAERPVFFALFPPGKSFRKQWPELGQLRHRDYAGRDFWTRFTTWTICPSRFCIKFLQRTEILFFIFITFICSYIRWILRFRVFRLIRVYFVVRRIIIIIQFLNN